MGGKTSKQLLMISIKCDKEEDIRKLIEVIRLFIRNILNFLMNQLMKPTTIML